MKTHLLSLKLKSFAVTTLCSLLATIAIQAADTENRGQFSMSDYKFATAAATGGATEVALGHLAVQKAGDSAVKQFGQRMVDDHGKAGKQLQELASKKGATLPMQPTAAQQKHIDHLSNLSGAEFDRAYVSMMLMDHKKDVKAFKRASEKCDDADLKAFAASTLPVVEDHLKTLEGIHASSKIASANTQ